MDAVEAGAEPAADVELADAAELSAVDALAVADAVEESAAESEAHPPSNPATTSTDPRISVGRALIWHQL